MILCSHAPFCRRAALGVRWVHVHVDVDGLGPPQPGRADPPYSHRLQPPIGSRLRPRRALTSLVTISVLFIGSASIAGCQNGTVTQSSGSQSSTQVSSSAAPLPGPTPPATAPAVVAAPAPAASPAALPPTATHVSAPRIAAVAPPSAGSARESVSCDADYYRNSAGTCVHRPQQAAAAPAGVTARCSDGEHSFSQHRQGSCSGHGGVTQWL
ncbi:MAG: DUF3761 domain-containing protein [Pseudonocardiaceae bacterium]